MLLSLSKSKSPSAMSDSAATTPVTTATKTAAAKRPGRPKRSADAAKLDADVTPVVAAPVIAAAPVAAAAEAPAAPKKRGGRKPKAVAESDATPAAAAPPAAAVVSDVTATPAGKTKKPAPTYIIGYGDEDKSFEEQKAAVAQDDHIAYKNKYFEKLNKQTLAQWAKEKLSNIKSRERKETAASKRQKRTKKPVDVAALNDSAKALLAALPSTAFAQLDGKYVTDFGPFGKLEAAALTGKTPLELPVEALWAASVYYQAKTFGFSPLGIVDCNRKLKPGTTKADNDYYFLTDCGEERVFVGERPKYYKEPIAGFQEASVLSKTLLKKPATTA